MLIIAVRMVTSIILVVDVSPDNMLMRSFMFEFPWIFGLSGLLFYFIGISQAIGQSSTASGWLPSALVIDVFGFSAVIVPFLCSWAFTLTLGALAKTDLDMAELIMSINYGLWALWTGGTGTIIFIAGLKLVRILKAHHKRNRGSSSYAAIKAGIFKIRMMASILAICLWSFATVLLVYAILRYEIMRTVPASILIGVLWNFMAVVTTILSFLLVIFDPKKGPNAALKSRSRSGGEETNTQEYTGAGSTTRPDRKLHDSSLMATESKLGDNDAILNALKVPYGQTLASSDSKTEIQQGGNEKSSKKLFSTGKATKKWSESTSSFSSNMELTSYEGPR
ncbi:hypothetical protein BDA99DRAFT_290206 [Phascolomyces articulosus]|uniref:Uncharacterized protein n=1 Tax=Phascolomyces articulosus TaxID=60185 RepID=A0AAD5JM56_9FUNG|nr:hypothetical protein BDA99DRAFT_290206 [Phascolomyces articulosus]